MVALIEIGDKPKDGCMGELPIQKTKVDIYYYDEDISEAELRQEIKDLKEFYTGVLCALPYPEKF